MCLLFVYLNNKASEGHYRIIIASQRDEFYQRPTQPAAFWESVPHCISGVDLEPGAGGGTWFGVSSHGKIGTLLNILTVPRVKMQSRGSLVHNYLVNDVDAKTYMEGICDHAENYAPFNLVLMEPRNKQWDIHYMSSKQKRISTLPEGVHGFGNSVRDVPFSKVCHGTPLFQAVVEQHNTIEDRDTLCERLFHMMSDKETIHLPDPQMQQQGGGWLEGKYLGQLARIFVSMPDRKYGSRTTTLFLMDSENNCEYIEKTMREPADMTDIVWDTSTHKFKMGNGKKG